MREINIEDNFFFLSFFSFFNSGEKLVAKKKKLGSFGRVLKFLPREGTIFKARWTRHEVIFS